MRRNQLAKRDDFTANIYLALNDQAKRISSHAHREVRVKTAVPHTGAYHSIRQCGQPGLNPLAEFCAHQQIRFPHMRCEHDITKSLWLDHRYPECSRDIRCRHHARLIAEFEKTLRLDLERQTPAIRPLQTQHHEHLAGDAEYQIVVPFDAAADARPIGAEFFQDVGIHQSVAPAICRMSRIISCTMLVIFMRRFPPLAAA